MSVISNGGQQSGGKNGEEHRELRWPVEFTRGDPTVLSSNIGHKTADIVGKMSSEAIMLPALAEKFGIPLGGLDVPKKTPMRVMPLYGATHVSQHQNGDKVYTTCIGLRSYPEDPRPASTYTMRIEQADSDLRIQEGRSGILTHWEHADPPEIAKTLPIPAAITEGPEVTNVSSWVKIHLVVPKEGQPYLAVNPIQYSQLTPKAQEDFESELRNKAGGEGIPSNERHRAKWRLSHLSSPYIFRDRDVALAIIALEFADRLGAENLGVDTITTRHLSEEAKPGRIRDILRGGSHKYTVI